MNAKTAGRGPQNNRKTPQFEIGWAPGYPKKRDASAPWRRYGSVSKPDRPNRYETVAKAAVGAGKVAVLSAGVAVSVLSVAVKLLWLLSVKLSDELATARQLSAKRRRWRQLSADNDNNDSQAASRAGKIKVVVKTKVTIRQ